VGAPRKVNPAQQGKLDTLAAISAEERVFRDNAQAEFQVMLREKAREFDIRKAQIIHELRASSANIRPVPHQAIQKAANAVNWNRYTELMSTALPAGPVEPVDVPEFVVNVDGTLTVNWWNSPEDRRIDWQMTGKWFADPDTLTTGVSMDEPEWDAAVREPWFANNVAPRILEAIEGMS